MDIYHLLKEKHDLRFVQLSRTEDVLDLISSILYSDYEYLKQNYYSIYDILLSTPCRYVKYYIVQKLMSNHSILLKEHDEMIVNNFVYHLLNTFISDDTKYTICFDTCLLKQWILLHIHTCIGTYDQQLREVIYTSTLDHFNKLEICRTSDTSLSDNDKIQLDNFMKNIVEKIYKHITFCSDSS